MGFAADQIEGEVEHTPELLQASEETGRLRVDDSLDLVVSKPPAGVLTDDLAGYRRES
jgi:hypothetical protein